MRFIKTAGLFLAAATVAEAIPFELLHLMKRNGKYDASCKRLPESGGKMTYEEKLMKDLTDMGVLARTAIESGAFTSTKAYSKYFLEGQEDQVMRMMQTIYNDNIPEKTTQDESMEEDDSTEEDDSMGEDDSNEEDESMGEDDSNEEDESMGEDGSDDDYDPAVENTSRGYTVDIKCGSDQSKVGCKKDSTLAFADPMPGRDHTTITFCNKYFRPETPETRNDINLRDGQKMNLDLPKKRPSRSSWCQGDEGFEFFEIGALTAFHEYTHLNIVGKQAGLKFRDDAYGLDFKSSGTDDVYAVGDLEKDQSHYKKKNPWQSARELKRLWQEHKADGTKYKPVTETIHNAESYAAAALEHFFMYNCAWSNFPPIDRTDDEKKADEEEAKRRQDEEKKAKGKGSRR